jgi:hypothetical protein
METGFFSLLQGMNPGVYHPPSAETRVSFWQAFGITPDVQNHLEDHFNSLNGADSYDKYGFTLPNIYW